MTTVNCLSLPEIRKIRTDVKLMNTIFNNYMSNDDLEEFVNHYMNMYDLETMDEYFASIDATNILDELEQYLSSDEMEELTEWLVKEFDLL